MTQPDIEMKDETTPEANFNNQLKMEKEDAEMKAEHAEMELIAEPQAEKVQKSKAET